MAPFKRARQPKMTTQSLLDFDLGESSSDSDFRIEDHNASDDDFSDGSKGDDESDKSEESDDDSDDGDDDSDDEDDDNNKAKASTSSEVAQLNAQTNGRLSVEQMLQQLDTAPKVPTKPICCVCLGDRSDDSNEIIECDGCGVSVHEGCYGVSDNVSISSTNSTCSTEPWFCEACRAGVSEPVCELCPNKGGIYKETDVGKWVHLVCALYVPGVAFGEVDQLSSVTLFEMPYSKWGAKVCALCEQSRFARTGICIGCDAGMCKTYFHVTCAQAAGFLTEAHHEEAEAADPFYAHCKVHSEKEMIKRRKRNFHTFRLNMQQQELERRSLKLDAPSAAQQRIQRKLLKHQRKYASHKQLKQAPWVPTQKMSRLLTTSASACKRLLSKAAIMSVDVESLERQEAQIAALTDIRKKWHVAPAFSVEFIGYYLDRIARTQQLKQQLAEMMANNVTLSQQQQPLRKDYDESLDRNKQYKAKQESLLANITQLHKQLVTLCPNKSLPSPSHIGRPPHQLEPAKTEPPPPPPTRPISVPTAAALKMGVGFPLVHLGPPGKMDSTRLLSTHAKSSPSSTVVASNNTPSGATATTSAPCTPTLGVQSYDCGICKRATEQHLLAKCDTCQLHYHLGCLNPPLTRHPKKSKLYGWQCSECDKSDESDAMSELPKGPRKSRTRFNKDGAIVPVMNFETYTEPAPPLIVCKEVGVLLAKRKSLDLKAAAIAATPSSATSALSLAAKKTLNKSLPPLRIETTTPTLAKKSKLSLSYVSPRQEAVEKAAKLTPNSLRKTKIASPIAYAMPPRLLSDEQPVVVLTSPIRAASGAGAKLQDPIETPDHDPLALPPTLAPMLDDASDPATGSGGAKAARKQRRKDKHRSRHNLSSDTEKSPNKEHKRKRKKKLHEQSANDSTLGIPKIKIKFKTLPLPGEVTPEAQFFYVSADMVRSAEEASRPTSVETVEELSHTQMSDALTSTPLKTIAPTTASATAVILNTPTAAATAVATASASATKTIAPTRKSSPRKANPRKPFGGSAAVTKANSSQTQQQLNCCICRNAGQSNNVVTCDECRKHYHFTCLDPPLKKTPKIRGYSWHCADCDPTDEER